MLNVLSDEHIVYNLSAMLKSGEMLATPSSLFALPPAQAVLLNAVSAGSLAGALKMNAPQIKHS